MAQASAPARCPPGHGHTVTLLSTVSLGRRAGHRAAAGCVPPEGGQARPVRGAHHGRMRDAPADRAAWPRDGAARPAGAVATGSGLVWTHLGPGPASYWARRMAHETAVHRADGQIAVGTRPVIDPEVAADGIAEWLGFLPAVRGTGRPERPAVLPGGKGVHFHVTHEGVAGEWLIRGERGGGPPAGRPRPGGPTAAGAAAAPAAGAV